MTDEKDFASWLMPGLNKQTQKGSAHSGNFGHAGRHGMVGGSAPASGVAPYSQAHQTEGKMLYKKAVDEEGYTYRSYGNLPTTGYMVSLPRKFGHEQPIPMTKLSATAILKYMTPRRKLVDNDSNLFFGGWKEDEHTFTFDLSRNMFDLPKTMSYARDGEQKSVWDIEKKRLIWTRDYFDNPDQYKEIKMNTIKQAPTKKETIVFGKDMSDDDIVQAVLEFKDEMIAKSAAKEGISVEEWIKKYDDPNWNIDDWCNETEFEPLPPEA